MRGVRGAGKKIKFRRILRVVAAERNGLCSHRQINAVQFFQRKSFAIGDDLARAADVDGAEFAAFEEKGAAGFLVVRQFDGLGRRHHAADHEPVEIGEMAGDFAGHKKVGDLKRVAQFLRGHADQVLRTRRAADGIFKHGREPARKTIPRQAVAGKILVYL